MDNIYLKIQSVECVKYCSLKSPLKYCILLWFPHYWMHIQENLLRKNDRANNYTCLAEINFVVVGGVVSAAS